MAGQLISHTIPYFSDHYIPYFSSCNNSYLSNKCLSTPPTTPQKSKYLVYSIEETHNGSRCCSLLPSMHRVFRIASFHINVEKLLTRISASWLFMSDHRPDWSFPLVLSSLLPQHFLYFFLDPQGQDLFRGIMSLPPNPSRFALVLPIGFGRKELALQLVYRNLCQCKMLQK